MLRLLAVVYFLHLHHDQQVMSQIIGKKQNIVRHCIPALMEIHAVKYHFEFGSLPGLYYLTSKGMEVPPNHVCHVTPLNLLAMESAKA